MEAPATVQPILEASKVNLAPMVSNGEKVTALPHSKDSPNPRIASPTKNEVNPVFLSSL